MQILWLIQFFFTIKLKLFGRLKKFESKNSSFECQLLASEPYQTRWKSHAMNALTHLFFHSCWIALTNTHTPKYTYICTQGDLGKTHGLMVEKKLQTYPRTYSPTTHTAGRRDGWMQCTLSAEGLARQHWKKKSIFVTIHCVNGAICYGMQTGRITREAKSNKSAGT